MKKNIIHPPAPPRDATVDIDATVARINSLLDIADRPAAEKGEDEAMWESESEARDLVGSIYWVHDYHVEKRLKKTVAECGSYGFKDTPVALYRLLYLFSAQARERFTPFLVDFEDMYKSNSLWGITSPHSEFVADPQFYKYEIMLSLRATRQHVQGREHGVICGVPGSDNGVGIASDSLRAWWDLLLRLVNRRWDVYGGNDFAV